MTSPARALPPSSTTTSTATSAPTHWDRLCSRVTNDPALSRMVTWLTPTLVTLLAAVLRLTNLAHPHAIMFDETYYVKDAWALWSLGYEGQWSEGADAALARGDASHLQTTASYVVHPPLGKWIIALGMALTGPGSSLGWRLTTAILGSLTVLVLYFVALQLTRSRGLATLAAALLAIDGLGIVMSRIALLDGILTFFIVLGVLFVVLDHRRSIPLLEERTRARRGTDADDEHAPVRLVGPVVWARPWLIAAGVTFGAAAAVKWSGLYALAVFGLYTVVTDALARRRVGIPLWPSDAVLRQGPASFLLMVGPALLTYLVSWTGWLVTTGGYDRQSDANPLVALWNYHASMLNFHVGLASPHPYASPAWQWPLLMRPTAIWVGDEPKGCGTDHCIAVISSIPNPLLWYGGVAAAVYLLYRFVRGLVERAPASAALTLPLVGLLATYVPWLLVPGRTIFQFYTIVMMPFLLLALALALREMAGAARAPLYRRQSGQRTVAVLLVVAVLVSAFFYPVWTGMSVPYEFWLIHNWLPGWI